MEKKKKRSGASKKSGSKRSGSTKKGAAAPKAKKTGASAKAGARKSKAKGSRRKARPATGKRTFPDLSPRAYEHPADRAALTALRSVPGFDMVVRKLFGLVSDRSLRLIYLASSVRVNENQFAGVHQKYLEAARVLDIKPPELFVAQTPLVNAGAIGVDRPFIVINSGALGLLNPDELQFVLAHELGHVMSGHVLYKTMLRLLLRMSLLVVSVPLGGAALFAILAALLEWDRKSELSADRAGLLVAQDPNLAYRVNMKLAGGGQTDQMSIDEFMAQTDEYNAGGSVIDSVMKVMNLIGASHPFPVLRLAELKKWVDSGEYDRILEGDYPRRTGDAETSVYEEFVKSSRALGDELASSKDPLAQLMKDLAQQIKTAGESLFGMLRPDPPEPDEKDEEPPARPRRPRKR